MQKYIKTNILTASYPRCTQCKYIIALTKQDMNTNQVLGKQQIKARESNMSYYSNNIYINSNCMATRLNRSNNRKAT